MSSPDWLDEELSRRRLLRVAGTGALAAAAAWVAAACGIKTTGSPAAGGATALTAGATQNPTGGGASAAGGAGKPFKIGFVSPRTGPTAGFGEADPHVLGIVRQAVAPGLKAGGQTYGITIVDRDSQSDPARAAQVAQDLINAEKVDLMLVTSTPETVNPIADACEAAGVPCLSTVEPWESWFFARGGKPDKGFKYTYHFCFGVEEFRKAYLSQWSGPVKTNNKVAAMWPNDADGNAIRQNLGPGLKKGGFTVVDPGAYEDGTNDYSAQIAKFKSEGCEIFNTFPIPPDFVTFWRQAAQQGFVPKIAQIAKTGLFNSQVEELGDLGFNLATAAYWSPGFPYKSSLTSVGSKQLGDDYTKATNRPWHQNLGTTLAMFDVAAAAMALASDPTDKTQLAAAFAKVKVDTPVGTVDFTKGPVPNVATSPIIGSQWVKATSGPSKVEMLITEHAADPNVPIQAQLIPYR
jgi:branched-chain amino acid transport system substrate-binding protein